MQDQIEILRKRFGSYQRVAKELGITERHLRNVRKGEKTSLPMKKLVQTMTKLHMKSSGDFVQ